MENEAKEAPIVEKEQEQESHEEISRKNDKEGDSKWLYISIGLAVIIVGLIIGIIVTSQLGFKKNKKSENENKEEFPEWKPMGDRIKTIWGEQLDPNHVWEEYPRPQMERKLWKNLNGFWDYWITSKDSLFSKKPDGRILVPFPIESSLSGVMKSVNEKQNLWYKKIVPIQQEWRDMKHLILHFEAVDFKAEVFINSYKVGEHTGGFSPFSFDIQKYVDFTKSSFTIIVKVFDPTDTSYQSVGKQTLTPNHIWYTPSTGIWQTVWIEPVNETYITNIEMTSSFQNKSITMKVCLNIYDEFPINFKVFYKGKQILNEDSKKANTHIEIIMPDQDFHPWSPSEPNLYNIEITLYSQDKSNVIDEVKTYNAIRTMIKEKGLNDKLRFKLNDKFIYNIGPLDQGFWPDGLFTPPSEEAMVWDMKRLKEMGFNTIRKHAKVECARYYYHCDVMGFLVWQDMPQGDIHDSHWDSRNMDGGEDKKRSEESKQNFYHEWKQIIESFKFFPSIVVWTTFNEAWGQFDTEKTVNFTYELDSTRLINSASGGNHRRIGDILDLHNYPAPDYFLHYDNEVNVLGEYGGLGLEIKGHTWKDDNWGYAVYQSKDEITYYYSEYAKKLEGYTFDGFSGAIYTQTTDCESEINGLITYDRKEMKVYVDKIREANLKLIHSLEN